MSTVFLVKHDPDQTLTSQSYVCSVPATRRGAEQYIQDHRVNDWEFWLITEMPLAD